MHSELSPIIKPVVWEICRRLGPSRLKDCYYLADGTSLALQLKHRMTDDLHFFSMNQAAALEAVAIFKLLKLIFPQYVVRIDLKLSNQLDVFVDNTKVSFMAYDYPLLTPLVDGSSITTELTGLKLASAQEIALMKALNIVRKPGREDYVDLYFLFQSASVDLAYILSNANRKFISNNKTDFSTKVFLERLKHMPNIPDKCDVLSKIAGDPLSPQDLETYFENLVAQYIKDQGHKQA